MFLPTDGCNCDCPASDGLQHIYQPNYHVQFKLKSVAGCDETGVAPLPDGSELTMDGTLTLRETICKADEKRIRFGKNEGSFRIRGPQQDLFEGHFCGTVGVNPSNDKLADRCCYHEHLLGSLCGNGINELVGWSLALSFDMRILALDGPTDPCTAGSRDCTITLDGVLIRPCPVAQPARKPQGKKTGAKK
ncbi:MAG TPA: hypothetical protein VE988_25875 [Gemmataceae bacterium]|nr:hypothetical protein [Gemmataceae bacterium]